MQNSQKAKIGKDRQGKSLLTPVQLDLARHALGLPNHFIPRRIQRKRTKGWRAPAWNCVNVTRPGPWGNPLRVGMWRDYGPSDAVRDYRKWLFREPSVASFNGAFGKPPPLEMIRAVLRGRDLMCWCDLCQPCHADVLLIVANAPMCEAVP